MKTLRLTKNHLSALTALGSAGETGLVRKTINEPLHRYDKLVILGLAKRVKIKDSRDKIFYITKEGEKVLAGEKKYTVWGETNSAPETKVATPARKPRATVTKVSKKPSGPKRGPNGRFLPKGS